MFIKKLMPRYNVVGAMWRYKEQLFDLPTGKRMLRCNHFLWLNCNLLEFGAILLNAEAECDPTCLWLQFGSTGWSNTIFGSFYVNTFVKGANLRILGKKSSSCLLLKTVLYIFDSFQS